MQPETTQPAETGRDTGNGTSRRELPVLGGNLLTNSRGTAQRRCSREQHLRYEELLIPVKEDDAPLRLGSLVHLGLEAWWLAVRDGREPLTAALDVLADQLAAGADPFEVAKARAMLVGYHARWIDDAPKYEVLGVEVELTPTPILNPTTGKPSRTWLIGGKLDAYVRERATGRKLVVEHKTTTEDIRPGSDYFKRLRMDSQVSTYTTATDAEAVLYDVLAKPGQRPLKATPEEDRQYTKPKYKQCPACKKKSTVTDPPHRVYLDEEMATAVECEPDPDGGPRRVCTDPGGRLYANMRVADETPEEYFHRITDAISEDVEAWYARAEVVRFDSEILEHQADTWAIARTIRDNQLAKRWPRNPEACIRYGRTCGYWALCVGEASPDDASLYMRVASGHRELSQPETRTAA